MASSAHLLASITRRACQAARQAPKAHDKATLPRPNEIWACFEQASVSYDADTVARVIVQVGNSCKSDAPPLTIRSIHAYLIEKAEASSIHGASHARVIVALSCIARCAQVDEEDDDDEDCSDSDLVGMLGHDSDAAVARKRRR